MSLVRVGNEIWMGMTNQKLVIIDRDHYKVKQTLKAAIEIIGAMLVLPAEAEPECVWVAGMTDLACLNPKVSRVLLSSCCLTLTLTHTHTRTHTHHPFRRTQKKYSGRNPSPIR